MMKWREIEPYKFREDHMINFMVNMSAEIDDF